MRQLLGLILLGCSVPASAAVHQCLDDAGRTHFRQFGCSADSFPIPVDPDPDTTLSVVTTTPLTPREQQALEALEKRLERDSAARARSRASNARARARQTQERARLCAEAERRLEALADTRRKGYSASAESRLEAEEARWRSARKTAC